MQKGGKGSGFESLFVFVFVFVFVFATKREGVNNKKKRNTVGKILRWQNYLHTGSYLRNLKGQMNRVCTNKCQKKKNVLYFLKKV